MDKKICNECTFNKEKKCKDKKKCRILSAEELAEILEMSEESPELDPEYINDNLVGVEYDGNIEIQEKHPKKEKETKNPIAF